MVKDGTLGLEIPDIVSGDRTRPKPVNFPGPSLVPLHLI